MTSLNPDQIYRRTQDSVNNLANKLQDLINSSQINTTIQREVELFDLFDELSDGNLSAEELNPIIENLSNMNLEGIASRGYLRYNQSRGEFRLNTRKIQQDIANGDSLIQDFNSDGNIDLKDIQAFEHAINYQEKKVISLEEKLSAVNDPDLLIQKEIEHAGERRGLKTDPARFDEFVDKIFGYFQNKDLSRHELSRIIELHDISEREDANFDLDKLDYYADLLSDKELPSKYLKTLISYEADKGFSAEARTETESLVNKIKETTAEGDYQTIRTIDQILRSRNIPLVDQEYTFTNLLNFLEDIKDPDKYSGMIIESWANKTIGDDNAQFKEHFTSTMQQYYQHYLDSFDGDHSKALKVTSSLRDIYKRNYQKLQSDIRMIDRTIYNNPTDRTERINTVYEQFNQSNNKMEKYVDLFSNLRSTENEDGFSMRNIMRLYNYDVFSTNQYTEEISQEKITEYIGILEGAQGRDKAEFLDYILKNRTIPFAEEGLDISSSNIDNFLSMTDNEESFFEFRLRDMATNSRLAQYPNQENSIYESFVDKFMSYKFPDPESGYEAMTNGEIMHAKYLFDKLKSKYRNGFDINELDFYVNALRSGQVEFSTLIKFIDKLHFLPADKKQGYMDILMSTDRAEEKDTILKYLKYA